MKKTKKEYLKTAAKIGVDYLAGVHFRVMVDEYALMLSPSCCRKPVCNAMMLVAQG